MVVWDMKKVLFGELEADDFVSPLSASVMFFVITMSVGWLVRMVNQAVVPEPLKTYVGNFFATMEMCAYFFENNFIFKHFGSVWLFIAVVIECFIANRTFYGASENPCHAVVDILEKRKGAVSGVVMIVVQALGGLASYRFARMVWALDMVPDHRDRYFETQCSTDLNVMLMFGFGIELAATLIDTWMGRQTLLTHSISDELIKICTGSLMIVLGINMTGMYFNPAMATGHTWGCEGTAHYEHLIVYWLGPLVGCYMAVIIDDSIHIDAAEQAVDSKKKKE